MTALDPSRRDALVRAREYTKRNDWNALAALRRELPTPLEPEALRLADDVAFALGQLRRHRDAILLVEQAFALEPTWRRASGLAYLHYAAAMCPPRDVPTDARALSRDEAREGFHRWIEDALEREPGSIKDLYRLGVWNAQVESAKDKPALRAFLAAIERYRALPEAERARRGDLTKVYVKALYAGARSALRLGRVALARRLAFACVRADAATDHVAPVFRFDMAGRACAAAGELDHAERAFRLALDADGPPRRDYLYGRLADVALRRGEPDAAAAWIERHTRAERRPAYLWRQLGDIHHAAGRLDEALAAWQAAVEQDRGGKHLTWTRIAAVHAARGDHRRAERTYRKAIDFARRRWSKDHRPALEGLAAIYRDRGKTELADKLLAPLAKAPARRFERTGTEGR
ncbi:MAG: tetratricopeptide repeat protein [Sandaracinaceae bacterium]|nr:tetratricopeptide repeat protein [Sandaracinaceae bacterium]